MKVFSLLSLTRNLENFTTKRITTTLTSCVVVWLCTCLCIYLILSKCGVLYRLFSVGHSRASFQINGSQLHTFFLLLTHRIGVVAVEVFIMCYKVIKDTELANMTISDIKTLVQSISQKPLGELRYYDLYQPSESSLGLYFIESPQGDMLYIGKTISRCVSDRIGAHLDSKVESFLNSLPKAVYKAQNQGQKPAADDNLHKVLIGLQEWRIAVIFIKISDSDNLAQAKAHISKAESALIYHAQSTQTPKCINRSNRKKAINEITPIKNL